MPKKAPPKKMMQVKDLPPDSPGFVSRMMNRLTPAKPKTIEQMKEASKQIKKDKIITFVKNNPWVSGGRTSFIIDGREVDPKDPAVREMLYAIVSGQAHPEIMGADSSNLNKQSLNIDKVGLLHRVAELQVSASRPRMIIDWFGDNFIDSSRAEDFEEDLGWLGSEYGELTEVDDAKFIEFVRKNIEQQVANDLLRDKELYNTVTIGNYLDRNQDQWAGLYGKEKIQIYIEEYKKAIVKRNEELVKMRQPPDSNDDATEIISNPLPMATTTATVLVEEDLDDGSGVYTPLERGIMGVPITPAMPPAVAVAPVFSEGLPTGGRIVSAVEPLTVEEINEIEDTNADPEAPVVDPPLLTETMVTDNAQESMMADGRAINSNTYMSIHVDAVGLFFGSSTSPSFKWDLFNDRMKNGKGLTKEYLHAQSVSLVGKFGVDMLINSVKYDLSSTNANVAKENMEILQIYFKMKNLTSGSGNVLVPLKSLSDFRNAITGVSPVAGGAPSAPAKQVRKFADGVPLEKRTHGFINKKLLNAPKSAGTFRTNLLSPETRTLSMAEAVQNNASVLSTAKPAGSIRSRPIACHVRI